MKKVNGDTYFDSDQSVHQKILSGSDVIGGFIKIKTKNRDLRSFPYIATYGGSVLLN